MRVMAIAISEEERDLIVSALDLYRSLMYSGVVDDLKTYAEIARNERESYVTEETVRLLSDRVCEGLKIPNATGRVLFHESGRNR